MCSSDKKNSLHTAHLTKGAKSGKGNNIKLMEKSRNFEATIINM